MLIRNVVCIRAGPLDPAQLPFRSKQLAPDALKGRGRRRHEGVQDVAGRIL